MTFDSEPLKYSFYDLSDLGKMFQRGIMDLKYFREYGYKRLD